MAIKLGSMFFRLGANTKGLEKADKDMRRFTARTKRNISFIETAAKRLGGVFVGIFAARAVKGAVMMADRYNVLQQRIKTATKATGGYMHVSKQLERISASTGSQLDTNVGLFQALSRASTELGATNEDMLKLTKTVNQLGVIGGSSTEAMKFGIRQFTQSMSSGVVRAEEFNSILENVPELGNRIAKGLGMSVGELRNAVITGKVLSQEVFQALLSQSEQVQQDFNDIDVSVGRAGQTLKNSIEKVMGDFFKVSGASDKTAKAMIKVSEVIGEIDAGTGLDTMHEKMSKIRIEAGTLFKILASNKHVQKIQENNKKVRAAEMDMLKVVVALRGRLIDKMKFMFSNIEANGNSPLAQILRQRSEEIAALELEMAARKQDRDNQKIEAEKKTQDTLNDVAKKGYTERQRMDALNAFLSTDIFRKGKEMELHEHASLFKKQISMAAKHSKTFFDMQKALALATAMLEAPKMILAAESFGTAMGGWPLGMAFGAMAAGAAGVQIGAIAAAQYSGARQAGGDVTANRMFRVNESGPELFSDGNKDFLLTGSKGGSITPNNALSESSNTSVVVNVYPIEGETARVEQSGDDENQEINVFIEKVDEMLSNGISTGANKISDTLQKTFGLGRRELGTT